MIQQVIDGLPKGVVFPGPLVQTEGKLLRLAGNIALTRFPEKRSAAKP